MEGMKKIKSTSFHQYLWNSEVEITWTSLITWHHKTSTKYRVTILMAWTDTIVKPYPQYWRSYLYTTECDKIDEEEAKKADEAENINCDNLDVYDPTISISIHCFPKEQYFPAQVEFVIEWIVNSKEKCLYLQIFPIDIDCI